ncbi:glutamyl-tRNA reductase [Enemella sp. A6]|uniref:glutamyl-tRNA reductase n=1 Tax=Enemella sp. A6 TaxID=3440152 RepID=UPI003EBEDB61
MSILAVSLSHRSASIDLLGRVSMDAADGEKLTTALLDSDVINEAVVVSTCNRTELYLDVTRFHGGLDDAISELASISGLDVGDVTAGCRVFYDGAAVGHLFQVASGLDSMVVGESQILGQVREALTRAQAIGSVGSALNALFQQGLRVGKKVQTATGIGGAGRSLITAAVSALAGDGVSLADRQVLVLGAGSMATLAAHTVTDVGGRVTLVNRTHDKAVRLAEQVGGRARPMAELEQALAEADVLITCTGARGRVLHADQIGTHIIGAIDLALPADIDESVGEQIPLVNLRRLMTQDLDETTAAEVAAARQLVADEVTAFLSARRAAQVTPTVVALRTMATEVMDTELERLHRRAGDLTDAQRAEVEITMHRIVDKLLHRPTVRVKQFAGDEVVDYAAALRDLFALDQQAVEAVSRAPEVP